jgi:hypothetical protein
MSLESLVLFRPQAGCKQQFALPATTMQIGRPLAAAILESTRASWTSNSAAETLEKSRKPREKGDQLAAGRRR